MGRFVFNMGSCTWRVAMWVFFFVSWSGRFGIIHKNRCRKWLVHQSFSISAWHALCHMMLTRLIGRFVFHMRSCVRRFVVFFCFFMISLVGRFGIVCTNRCRNWLVAQSFPIICCHALSHMLLSLLFVLVAMSVLPVELLVVVGEASAFCTKKLASIYRD